LPYPDVRVEHIANKRGMRDCSGKPDLKGHAPTMAIPRTFNVLIPFAISQKDVKYISRGHPKSIFSSGQDQCGFLL